LWRTYGRTKRRVQASQAIITGYQIATRRGYHHATTPGRVPSSVFVSSPL
jgi:hypothetical protein